MADASGVKCGELESFVSLSTLIDTTKANSLNNKAGTYLKSILSPSSEGMLFSDDDVDHEMILVLPFREKVKIRGIRLICRSPPSTSTTDVSGVKDIKLFINQPNYSFDDCSSNLPSQSLSFTPKQIQDGIEVPLKFVKFQSVDSLTVFIQSNQSDSAVSFLNGIDLIGCSTIGLDMNKIQKTKS